MGSAIGSRAIEQSTGDVQTPDVDSLAECFEAVYRSGVHPSQRFPKTRRASPGVVGGTGPYGGSVTTESTGPALSYGRIAIVSPR